MYPDYGNIKFSVGDLIVDRERKEIGILIKRSKILKTLQYDNFTKQEHFSDSSFCWEVMWIKEEAESRKIGIFENLDRILSEETMKLSICCGIMEHFAASSKEALDFELDKYKKENKWI